MSIDGDRALPAWIETTLGHKPTDPALFGRALTHSRHSDPD